MVRTRLQTAPKKAAGRARKVIEDSDDDEEFEVKSVARWMSFLAPTNISQDKTAHAQEGSTEEADVSF